MPPVISVDRSLDDLIVVESARTIAGAYAGKLLADSGAHVTTFCEPSTARTRWGSVEFTDFLDYGKTLEFDTDKFESIEADIVILEIDDVPPQELLDKIAHRSVVVVISPWGLTGLWAGTNRPWSELTLHAEAGSLSLRGLPGRAPVTTGSNESYWVAGTLAAGSALTFATSRTAGAVIDLSLLEATAYSTSVFASLAASTSGRDPESAPVRRRLLPSVEPASNGWVGFNLATAQNLQDFVVMIGAYEWLDDPHMMSPSGRYERPSEWNDAVHAWTTLHTVTEIVERAGLFRIPCAPVHDARSIVDDPQVVMRKFLRTSKNGRYLRPETPYIIDGIRPSASSSDRHIAPDTQPRATTTGLPLEGLRVLDLGTWWAGSMTASMMAAFGADVIKVESTRRLDGARTLSATGDTTGNWWEKGFIFLGSNFSKRSVTLDFSSERGRGLLVDLIRSADVLVENFAPRVIESVGLDWDAVHRINPDLVMVRMPAYGLTGPRRDMVGYAQTVEQYSGMCSRTGFSDSAPINPNGAADPMGGANAYFAASVALHRQSRGTGGQLVEAALSEAALLISSEQVVEWSANQTLLERLENRSRKFAPQGVYPCKGEDQWVAISVVTDEQFNALRTFAEMETWTQDARLDSAAGRLLQQDALDADIARWTSTQTSQQVTDNLISIGVPAATLADPGFLFDHPHISSRGYFESVDHPVAGKQMIPALPLNLVGNPGWVVRPAPLLGQHNTEILVDELGLTAVELEDLEETGVIGTMPRHV